MELINLGGGEFLTLNLEFRYTICIVDGEFGLETESPSGAGWSTLTAEAASSLFYAFQERSINPTNESFDDIFDTQFESHDE